MLIGEIQKNSTEKIVDEIVELIRKAKNQLRGNNEENF